jgi:hypothetical protein
VIEGVAVAAELGLINLVNENVWHKLKEVKVVLALLIISIHFVID